MLPVNLQQFFKQGSPSLAASQPQPQQAHMIAPSQQQSLMRNAGMFDSNEPRLPDETQPMSPVQAAQLFRMHLAQNGGGNTTGTTTTTTTTGNGGPTRQQLSSQQQQHSPNDSWKYNKQAASSKPYFEPYSRNQPNNQGENAAVDPRNQQQKLLMPLVGLANMLASQAPPQPPPSIPAPVAVPATVSTVSAIMTENAQQNPLMNPLPFGSYWPEDLIVQLASRGILILGPLRVNQRDYTQSFVPHPTEDVDIAIPGVTLRNGAFNGDLCAVQILSPERLLTLMPQSEAQQFFSSKNNTTGQQQQLNGGSASSGSGGVNNENDDVPDRAAIISGEPGDENVASGTAAPGKQNRAMYGRVVAIMRKVHPRVCAGTLRRAPSISGDDQAFLLSPVDSRIPRLIIPGAAVPQAVRASLSRYIDMMFIAEIIDWPDVRFARGQLRQQLGVAGNLRVESDAILWSIGIDPASITEFGAEAQACLPPADWQPPPNEISFRLDLRQSCVFTCDPATARDLDDAISCELLPCGVFEVGVHIADVSYFVREGSALDQVAAQRATSTYLAERVVPMLPERLSSDLCSLNPGVDRLTFSVIWHLDPAGNVLSEWIGRTIIRSCCKLNYELAMDLIDAKEGLELPTIYGNFTVKQIIDRLNWLHALTQSLRQRRAASGAISLDQVKLKFSLAPETGQPIGFSTFKRMASNELIEELMLLANMAVARKINTRYPDLAVLRRHPAPQKSSADRLVERFAKLGVPIDFTTSGTLSASLNRLSGTTKIALLNSVIRINQLAVYFRADSVKSGNNFARHYALACDCYTHFTSPIRRYADVLVHRQLAAACYGTCSPGEQRELDRVLRICNEKKQMARLASDESSRLYYAALLREAGPMREQGIVIGVLDRAFDVLVIRTGMVARVYVDALFSMFQPNQARHGGKEQQVQSTEMQSQVRFIKPEETIEIQLFAPLDLLLQHQTTRKPEPGASMGATQHGAYVKQQKLVKQGALITVVIRPMIIVDLILRHSPNRNDNLRWEALLDPAAFISA